MQGKSFVDMRKSRLDAVVFICDEPRRIEFEYLTDSARDKVWIVLKRDGPDGEVIGRRLFNPIVGPVCGFEFVVGVSVFLPLSCDHDDRFDSFEYKILKRGSYVIEVVKFDECKINKEGEIVQYSNFVYGENAGVDYIRFVNSLKKYRRLN